MKVNKMNGLRLLCLIGGFILLTECQVTSSQTFQQLSYANAELGQKLIRPPQTTTPSTNDLNYSVATIEPVVSTTPKATGFFSGIRNFFSRNSGTTTTARPTVRPTPTTRAGPIVDTPVVSFPQQNFYPASPSQNARTRSGGANMPIPSTSNTSAATTTTTSTTSTTTTTTVTTTTTTPKPSSIDDFPALPPRRNHHNNNRVTTQRPANPSTPFSEWNIHGNANQGSRQSTSQNAWTDRRLGGSLPNLAATTTHRPSYSLPTAQSMSNIHSGGHSGGGRPSHNNNNNKKAESPLATDDEIETLTESLFEKSTPNIFPSMHVNLQGRTRSSELSDQAPMPLLQLDESILDATETLIKMRALFDNYEMDAAVNEHVSPIERKEENEFINAVLATSVMRTAMKFLQDKGVVTADPKTHFDLLKTIWFTLYSRTSGKVGSSGFEHVFLHEIKNNTIGGLHNWVYFYHKEGEQGTKHSIDYQGYMKSQPLGTKGQYVKYRLNYDGIVKPVNAVLIGTLPELEMALYTVCFEVHKSECPVSLGGTKLTIRTYPFRYRGKRLIGSAFPE